MGFVSTSVNFAQHYVSYRKSLALYEKAMLDVNWQLSAQPDIGSDKAESHPDIGSPSAIFDDLVRGGMDFLVRFVDMSLLVRHNAPISNSIIMISTSVLFGNHRRLLASLGRSVSDRLN